MLYYIFFFFNDTATTEIYTLSLHDALPIFRPGGSAPHRQLCGPACQADALRWGALHLYEPGLGAEGRLPGRMGFHSGRDRKSTRLNSSHANISYAVFCLKKKNTSDYNPRLP